MAGVGKPKLCTKFEVASFSRCANIEGKPLNVGELSRTMVMPTLYSVCDFMMGLGKPQQRAKFEVVSSSRCRNIIGDRGTPTFWGSPLAQGRPHFFLWV